MSAILNFKMVVCKCTLSDGPRSVDVLCILVYIFTRFHVVIVDYIIVMTTKRHYTSVILNFKMAAYTSIILYGPTSDNVPHILFYNIL